MNHPRRVALGLACAASIVAAVVPVGSAAARTPRLSKTQTINVAYFQTATMLPAIVAEDKGIFRRNGLHVILKYSDIATVPSLLPGEFQIAYSTETFLLNAAAHGVNDVEVSNSAVDTRSNPTNSFVVPSSIQTASDLTGKTVLTLSIDGNTYLATKVWLKQHGVDPNSVSYVAQPTDVNPALLLESGKAQAATLVQPYSAQALAQSGYHNLGDTDFAVAPTISEVMWIANGAWAASHRTVISAWKRSLDQAIKYIHGHVRAAKTMLAKASGQSPALVAETPLPTYHTQPQISDLAPWVPVMHEFLTDFPAHLNLGKLVFGGK